MSNEFEWQGLNGSVRRTAGLAGAGMLRAALLFGSAAAALAIILTPLADNTSRKYAQGSGGIDSMSTGSISDGYRGEYTVRRSVLQGSMDSVCVIRDNGTREGDC